ncbi:MAG: tetratricopeptide repeat protein, partial [Rhodanobacteraceae bacterium]
SGLRALEAGDLALARQKLDRAYSYSPLNAGINFAEGNLHLARGEPEVAESFYRETLRLDSTHVGACNNLGVLALEAKRWNLAIQCFHRALASAPNDAKLHYLLARAEIAAGDFLAAGAAISTAVKLDPSHPEFLALQNEIRQAADRR